VKKTALERITTWLSKRRENKMGLKIKVAIAALMLCGAMIGCGPSQADLQKQAEEKAEKQRQVEAVAAEQKQKEADAIAAKEKADAAAEKQKQADAAMVEVDKVYLPTPTGTQWAVVIVHNQEHKYGLVCVPGHPPNRKSTEPTTCKRLYVGERYSVSVLDPPPVWTEGAVNLHDVYPVGMSAMGGMRIVGNVELNGAGSTAKHAIYGVLNPEAVE